MNVFGIFAKHPVPGQVKTRLAAAVGPERAAALYAAFLGDLAGRFRDCGDRRFLGHAPDAPATAAYFQVVSQGHYDLWAQPALPLGGRMAAFFGHSFALGAQRAVLIGSDSPTVPRQSVEQAFGLLDNHDCVLGPAADGGYWLVGMSRPLPGVFEDVAWSTPRVLGETVARVAACGGRLGLVAPWYDVDTIHDLEMLCGHLAALRAAGSLAGLERTAAAVGVPAS